MRKILLFIIILFAACSILPSNAAIHKKNAELTEEQIQQKKEALTFREDAYGFYAINDIDNTYLKLTQIPDNLKIDEDYLLLANIMQDKGKDDEALKFLNEALKINPKFYKAYYNIGIILEEQNKIQEAFDNFKQSVKYNKDFAYGYYNAGLCCYKQENYKRAKSYFNRAILRKKDAADFYYNLALTYKKLGNEKYAQKALNVYNELVKR